MQLEMMVMAIERKGPKMWRVILAPEQANSAGQPDHSIDLTVAQDALGDFPIGALIAVKFTHLNGRKN